MSVSPTIKFTPEIAAHAHTHIARQTAKGRARSNSLVKVEEVGAQSQEEVLDQSAYVNINAEWVNYKGMA